MQSFKSALSLTKSAIRFPLLRAFSTTQHQYEYLIYEKKDKVGLIRFNRPQALNAASQALILEMNDLLSKLDNDSEIGAIVLTGSEKAFIAGADIKEMSTNTFPETYKIQLFSTWDHLNTIRKPVIAAVNGYALGGGCELAMMCDIILAGSNAQFGQPELKWGTITGAGASVRLPQAVGKSKAMELILACDRLDAKTAYQFGLVSRVYEPAQLVDEAVKMGNKIASFSQPIVAMAKEAVNKAYELPLSEGLSFEKKLFWSTFGTKDQKEGMSAFAEKRTPNFKNE